MVLVRKLVLRVMAVLLTFAFIASSASAQLELLTEPGDQHCPEVTVVSHAVAGGCHFEFASTVDVPVHVYTPSKVTVFSCEWFFEGLIDSQGMGYVTEAILDPPHSGGLTCPREPCEEAIAPENHPIIPWPFQIVEHGIGDERVDLEFCAQVAGGEGIGNWCELHLEFTDLGGHQYEVGDAPGGDPEEVICENSPGFGYTGPHPVLSTPTSLEAHFAGTGTDYEVIH